MKLVPAALSSIATTRTCIITLGLLTGICLSPGLVLAQQDAPKREPNNVTLDDQTGIHRTLTTLETFIKLSDVQQKDIREQQELIESEESAIEQTILKRQLTRLREELRATKKNFREIAAGTDITTLEAAEEQAFNLQEEILALLKPAFEEMREMTAHVRQKTSLKEKIVYYEERLPVIEKVIANISRD